jgi:cytoskeletal protein RodZ
MKGASMNIKSISVILLVAVMFGGIWFAYREKQSAKQSASSQVSESTQVPQETIDVTPVVQGGSIVTSEIALTIISPTNGATVTTAKVVVTGKTKPNAEVFVNDEETVADASGNFSVTLSLDEGDNPIVISANDDNGNVAEKELIVNYDSGN